MEYDIIKASNSKDLLIGIQEAAKEGWKVQGGICSTESDMNGNKVFYVLLVNTIQI